MAKHKPTGDYYDVLRARFSGRETAQPAAAFRPPAAPGDYRHDAGAGAETPAGRFFDPTDLRAAAADVNARIEGAARADTAFAAQALRFGVALVWLAVALWYARFAVTADGPALAQLFVIVGGAAFVAAMIAMLLISGVRRSAGAHVESEGVVLGQQIALQTTALNETLGGRVDRVSAEAFLKGVAFANASPDAPAQFRAYIGRAEPAGPSADSAAIFAACLLVAAVLAVAAALGFGGAGALTAATPLADAPFAMTVLAAGLALYGGAGFLFARLGGRRRQSAARAEAAAFAAFRKGFAAADGTAPDALAARLNPSPAAALAPDQALAPDHGSAPRHSGAQPPADPALRDADSDWRRRDSGPRFYDPGFQAAPKTFRVDAFEKKNRT